MKKVKNSKIKKKGKKKSGANSEHEWIFINGKQKRIKKPLMIDGIPEDEWLMRNADPVWLHQNERWDLLMQLEEENDADPPIASEVVMGEDGIPF